MPRNIAANFGLLDIEIARADDDAEAEEFAKERVKSACREAGLSDVDLPCDRMIEVADREHTEKYGSSEGTLEQEDASEAPEYQGESLS